MRKHRIKKWHIVAVLAVATISTVSVAVVNKSPVPPVTQSCDPTLWNHVYHPQRLTVVEQCKTVTGTIFSVKTEADGDLHIRLSTDDPSLINSVNVSGQQGKLVVEPVCVNPVTQADAVSACAGYTNQVTIPKVGDRVTVIGSYVLDTQHGGWAEIHPASVITIH